MSRAPGAQVAEGQAPWSPARLAAVLRLPTPTEEQCAAIAAPLRPSVVVAGAGSGKTETMAARVVWLVANAYVRPEDVLGLTFTRKAAGELADRVRVRLQQLAASGVLAAEGVRVSGEPTVLTYDAFARALVAEHGLRLGVEPGAHLLSEAGAWQLAARVVAEWDGPMDGVESAPSTVVAAVLRLHDQLAGHLLEVDDVVDFEGDLLRRWEGLPRPGHEGGTPYASVRPVLDAQRTRLALLPLVRRLREEHRRLGVTDFAGVGADAARLALQAPEVGQALRNRHRAVLLDEFQDSSVAQLRLLLALFGERHPVTAVGDPCQSVYGWRGAGAGTLSTFLARTDAGQGDLTHLRTSFRNDRAVLEIANVVAGPLRSAGFDVPVLRARAEAAPGRVDCRWFDTATAEAEAIAELVASAWSAGEHSIAVLVRARRQVPELERALHARALPVEVVGVGGLLGSPEVVELVAMLEVLADPRRGDALIRVLAGSRWRLGAKDLMALGRWSDHRRRQAEARGQQGPTLIDVLVGELPSGDLSPVGLSRCRALRQELAQLRRSLVLPLPELVAEVLERTGLTVEASVRGGDARRNLDRFLGVCFEFVASQVGVRPPSLVDFLTYLDAAREHERGMRSAEPSDLTDRVQLLTVHAAKGLEWDLVVVPGLVQGGFPAGTARDLGWLKDPGLLPSPLRGDAAALPVLRDGDAADQRGLRDVVEAFGRDAGHAGVLEERRLAYVAVTRARHRLVCTGSRWGSGRRPRHPSTFLREVAAALAIDVAEWDRAPASEPPPEPPPPVWPVDPLGQRRGDIEAAALLVTDARAALGDHGGTVVLDGDSDLASLARLLLAERDATSPRTPEAPSVPEEVSVSQLTAIARDRADFLRRLRRPLPTRPSPQARVGTAMHAWIEARSGSPALLDLEDIPGAADAGAVPAEALAELQQAFLGSAWAQRTPIEVEAPFELLLDGRVVRGRADAVFAAADGGIEVVDWKTGPPAKDDPGKQTLAVQLAVYRLAFAGLYGLPVDRVRASFHHIREQETVEASDLPDISELRALIRGG